jgi:cytochrome c553
MADAKSGHALHMIPFRRARKISGAFRGKRPGTHLFLASNFVLLSALATCLSLSAPNVAAADSLADTVQTCSGCHGEQGVPVDKTIPVIWGQRREYLLKELHDFKTGHRKNETMAAIVDPLTKTDMEQLASYFASQKWPKLDQPAPADDVKAKAMHAINMVNCRDCHQNNFQGDYVRPSLRGQQQDYLLKTMTDFRTGERSNSAAMTALMRALNEDDLQPVAAYLSSLSPEVPAAGK